MRRGSFFFSRDGNVKTLFFLPNVNNKRILWHNSEHEKTYFYTGAP